MPKRRHESKCDHEPKRRPYGTKGTNPYCTAHDCHTNYSVSKKAERHKAKLEIKRESTGRDSREKV
jgi:hypothetical protein